MDWKAPFIVYRIASDGSFTEVYHAQNLQKATYWLTYIAEVGDCLCSTPAHPRNQDSVKQPVYWSHKSSAGKIARDQQGWHKEFLKGAEVLNFPVEQLGASEQAD